MKRKIKLLSLLLALVVLAASLAGCQATQKSSDSTDTTPIPANGRVIGTSVAVDEILDKLDYDNVVGVPHTDAYKIPDRYKNAKELGSPMNPNNELIKSLKPDIVFTPKSLEGQLKKGYDDIGVRSYFVNLESTDGMFQSILDMGKILGREEQANKLNADYQQFKKELAARHSSGKKLRVLILMGLPGGSYTVATESSNVGSLAKMAGYENVYGDGNGKDFMNISPEDMLQKDPDIIFRTSHALPDQVRKSFQDEFKNNDIWRHFRAVKEGKVYDLDNTMFGMSARFNYKEAIAELERIANENQ